MCFVSCFVVLVLKRSVVFIVVIYVIVALVKFVEFRLKIKLSFDRFWSRT